MNLCETPFVATMRSTSDSTGRSSGFGSIIRVDSWSKESKCSLHMPLSNCSNETIHVKPRTPRHNDLPSSAQVARHTTRKAHTRYLSTFPKLKTSQAAVATAGVSWANSSRASGCSVSWDY